MKILMSAPIEYPARGGAEISFETFYNHLKKTYDVKLMYPTEDSAPLYVKLLKSYPKIIALSAWWKKKMRKELKDNNYGWVITQHLFTPPVVETAEELGVNSLVFVRNFSFTAPRVACNPLKCHNLFYNLPFRYKIQYPFIKYRMRREKRALEKATVLAANSRFTSKVVEKAIKRKPELVVYPPIKEEKYKVENNKPKYITFIAPGIYKGIDNLVKIARELPEKEFLVVGSPGPKSKKYLKEISKMDNVEYLGFVEDIKDVYKKTRVLICPVNWYEPFGRTPAEAMVSGIPSIVAKKGGLPEVVGDSGSILNTNDSKVWVKEIEKYFNEDFYKDKSEICKNRYKKFLAEEQVKKLEKALERNS